MRKKTASSRSDELRSEYDFSQMRGGVRGKYLERMASGSNLVLIDPDLSRLFPTAEAVNRALRLLAEAGRAAVKR